MIKEAIAKVITRTNLTEAEAAQLKEVEELVARVIAVDHFDPAELKPHYVELGHNTRGRDTLAAE